MALHTQGFKIEIEDPVDSGSWVELGEVTGITLFDGEASEIPSSHLQSIRTQFLVGLPDEGRVTIRLQWDPSDASHAILRTRKNGTAGRPTLSNFRNTYTDPSPSTTDTYNAYVMRLTPSIEVDSKIEADVSLRITGAVVEA